MPKSHNMGRKSHKVQAAELEQNMSGMNDELGTQPTRPTGHPAQGTKSGSDEPRNTK